MERAEEEHKWKYNKAVIAAVTDEELTHLKVLVDDEIKFRGLTL